MNADSELARGETLDEHVVVAAFADRTTARAAAKALRDEGFHKAWIGVTRASVEADARYNTGLITTKVDAADDSVGAKIGRFFSGETNGADLYDSLTRRGVDPDDARRIDASIEPNDVILTVNGSNYPEFAAQIIEDFEGDVLAGGFDESDRIAADQRFDEAGRAQLRDDRLRDAVIPVLSEDIFIVSSIGLDDLADDDSGIGSESTPGTRSMGGSAGTMRRPENG
jgi:hypothetical protein